MKSSSKINFESFDWDILLKECWDRKALVVKKPFGNKPFDDEELFRTLVHYCKIAKPDTIRVIVDNKLMYGDLNPYFPQYKEKTFKAYSQRLERLFKGKEYGIVFDRFQSAMRLPYWNYCKEFVAEINNRIGLPAGKLGNTISLIIGNYKQTPFGMHKDPESVFCFPIMNTKMMRVWPLNTLRGKSFNYYLDDYKKLNSKSMLLKAEEGDLIYWPSSYWHVAESKNKKSMVSLHFAYSREVMAPHFIESAFKNIITSDKIFTIDDSTLNPMMQVPHELWPIKNNQKIFFLNSLKGEVNDLWLKYLSSHGFKMLPSLLSVELPKEDFKLVLNKHCPVIYREIDQYIAVYLNGHKFSYRKSKFLVSFLKKLTKQKNIQINVFRGKYSIESKKILRTELLIDLLNTGVCSVLRNATQ